MLYLIDTFNDVVISRHKTLAAMVRANKKHARMIRRANGESSYIPTEYRQADGSRLSDSDAQFCDHYYSNH